MSKFVNPNSADESQLLARLIEPICDFEVGDSRRKPQINKVMLHLRDAGTIQIWRRSLAAKYYLQDEIDDVEQIIYRSILDFLWQVNAATVTRIHAFFIAHLYHTARHAVMSYQESSDRTGIAGMTSVERRKKRIVKGRAELTAQTGVAPTNAEVKEHVNQTMLATRADAARQSALIVDSDFQAGSVSMADPTVLLTGDTHEDEVVQVRLELDEAVRGLTRHLRAAYPGDRILMQCAISWMRCIYIGQQPQVSAIVELTGHTEEQVKSAFTKLHKVLPKFRSTFAAAS